MRFFKFGRKRNSYAWKDRSLMNEARLWIAILKFGATGVLASVLGVWQLSLGDRQSMVSGGGSLLVGIAVLSFISWAAYRRIRGHIAGIPDTQDGQKPASRSQLLWLGIFFTLAPGLLYFYYYFSMTRFDPGAVVFLGIPLVFAGVGLFIAGLLSAVRNERRSNPPQP